MAKPAGAAMQALDLLRAQPGDPGPTRNRHKIFWKGRKASLTFALPLD
jgi:hypothetical protein